MKRFLSILLTLPYVILVQAQDSFEDEKSRSYSEWSESLTVADVVNIILLASFTLVIIWFVARTFRGKAEA